MDQEQSDPVHQTLDQFGITQRDWQSSDAIRRRIYHLERGDLVKWETRSESPAKAYDVIDVRPSGDRYIAIILSNRNRVSILDPGYEGGHPSIRHKYPSGTSSERLRYLKLWVESPV